MSEIETWISATGVRPVRDDVADAVIPEHVLNDPALSLIAKGLLALLIAEQGRPINPYEDPYEAPAALTKAVDELIAAGLAVRVVR